MKKIILFLCLTFVFIFSISCQEEIVDNKVSFFFEEYNIPFKKYYFGLNNSNGYLIAELFFEYPDKISLFFSSSGYFLKLSSINIDVNEITIDFIKIWIGAEENTKVDNRILNKYRTKIYKNEIDTNMWILETYNNTELILKAEDSCNSVKYYDSFFVKDDINVKTDMSECSESIGILTPENHFEILDINCSELDKDDLWIQIKFNDIVGYIPFTSLGENWTIIDNNFEIQKTNDK